MEIERKYLIRELPENLETYAYHDIEQAYLCTAPVVRIRRQDDRYILTYKSSGMMAHEEYNPAPHQGSLRASQGQSRRQCHHQTALSHPSGRRPHD